jgi:hypothetical protein
VEVLGRLLEQAACARRGAAPAQRKARDRGRALEDGAGFADGLWPRAMGLSAPRIFCSSLSEAADSWKEAIFAASTLSMPS